MKIMIVDRDEVASRLMASKLEAVGYQVLEEPSKENAKERAIEAIYDVIIMDPAPLTDVRQHVFNIRRAVRYRPYFILSCEDATYDMAIEAGMNHFLSKPVDSVLLDEKLYSAEELKRLLDRFADEAEDFPSGGGIIAKSAFNQLFLSAIDRADRYGEEAYVLFITLDNYNDIYHGEGPSSADNATAQLCSNVMAIRRQSDIVGQTGKNEYSLLLQRPNDKAEPKQAADRFADMVLDFPHVFTENGQPFEVSVRLMELPSGQISVNHRVVAKKKA